MCVINNVALGEASSHAGELLITVGSYANELLTTVEAQLDNRAFGG